MKKVFFAVLAIAAMMVSCQKNGLVNTQKETPEVNEPQPVVLGSNIFKAPATKASIDDMASWKAEGNNIYVWALNQNEDAVYPATEPDDISKVFIDNVAASLKEDSYAEGAMKGSLNLLDEGGKPFYYGASDADIYDFYAYYLGYNPGEEDATAASSDGTAITVTGVKVSGTNDIMAATTDKTADAVVEGGTMVNPRYLYSQYSARHGVTPNLVFNHQLSKFTFNVRCGSTLPEGTTIKLTGISFVDTFTSGTLTLTGDTPSFAPDALDVETPKNIALTLEKTLDTVYGAEPVGYLMVVPAGEEKYTLQIDYTQISGDDTKSGSLTREISYVDVIVDAEAHTPATSIDAGKHYVVNITVYGFEEVKVNVQLVPWEDAGTVTIDPDQKEDGIMKQVNANVTIAEEAKTCTLYAEDFEPGNEIYCVFTGEGADSKLVKAPIGTYTVDNSTTATGIESIEVEQEGIIASVVTTNPATE